MRSALAAILFALALAACGAKDQAPPPNTGPIKEYSMRGVVRELDAEHQVATVAHEEIKGWMGAMTMEYQVKDKKDFSPLHPGDKIDATVFVQGDDFWIGRIKPAPPQ